MLEAESRSDGKPVECPTVLQVNADVRVEILFSMHRGVVHLDGVGRAIAVALNEIDAEPRVWTLLHETSLGTVETVSPLHARFERMRTRNVGK